MSLSEMDKIWLENMVDEKIRKALTVKVKYEQVRDPDTGQPYAVPKLIERDEYLPAWWIQYLPFNEGALRGIQEDVARNNNKINDFDQKLSVIGNVIIQTENSLKCIATLSDHIKQLDFDNDTKLIEGEVINDGESDN